MKRKPNARGGRNNKTKNTATRARFSNWKPPSKNIRDRITSHKGQRDARDARDTRSTDRNGSARIALVPKSKPESEGALGEIVIPESILRDLCVIFDLDCFDRGNVSVHKKKTALSLPGTSDRSNPAPSADRKLPFQLSKPTKRAVQVTEAERKIQQIHDRYTARGFLSEEIFSCIDALMASKDESEVYLRLLSSAAGRDHPAPPSRAVMVTDSGQDLAESMLFNEELMTELEVLQSMYSCSSLLSDGCPSFPSMHTRHVILSSVPCTRVDVQLLAGTGNGGEVVAHIVLLITRADIYPAEGSMLFGWLLPRPESVGNTDSTMSVEHQLTGGLTTAVCREISLHVMADIQRQLVTHRCIVSFDFIQGICEGLASWVPATASGKRSGNSSSNRQPASLPECSGDGASGSVASSPSCGLSSAEELRERIVPEPLIKPLTNYRQCPEYREAFNAALNAGLKGACARAHARDTLQYVLPTSVMEALAVEEKYAEDLLDRTCSVESIGTKEVIDGAKVLSDRLRISKQQAKSLFAAGKDALFVAGDWFARDQESLRDKCIRSALAIFESNLERKEAKRRQKMEEREARERDQGEGDGGDGEEAKRYVGRRRGKQRGPTLRDAYDIAGRRIRHGDDDINEPESDSEDSVATEDSATADDVIDEDVDSEPTEAELQLEAERREKDRQRRELQSRQMRNAYSQKKKNPKYLDIMARRASLPAYKMKDTILRAIAENSVVVVSGDTGCGKTTQIPQMVLDHLVEEGSGGDCNILVTQPRRISAVSVAEHIARERMESVGQSAGYHIRLEAKKGPSTRLLMMTTGVLLRRLQVEKDLEGISHVFVDEVHERDINTDFLLIVLKQLLCRRPDLKIVLMSATLNADLFLTYFRSSRRDYGYGGRAFPVETFFLEDALQHTGFEITAESKSSVSRSRSGRGGEDSAEQKAYKDRLAQIQQLRGKYSDRTIMSLKQTDESKVNLELIQSLVVHITKQSSVSDTEKEGAILIFVPGLSDIRDITDCLKATPALSSGRGRARILPLHSSLSSHEQSLVFQVPPRGVRKIIVSTNIAETSVTIEDVVYVIDTCRVKETRYDEECQMDVLEEQWISQANARQRRGRAGRVRSGVCYHLACQFTVDTLPAYTVPEMLRMSLEDLVLQILALDLGDPYEFLLSAISPPEHMSISRAILYLESLNAATISNVDTSNPETMLALNNTTDTDFDLISQITPLGYHLAALPISPRIGKLILYGVLLKCIDPILIIASAVSAKSPFVVPFGERDAADAAKLSFLEGNSDLLSMLNVFRIWKDQFGTFPSGCGGSSKGRRATGGANGRDAEEYFCRSHFLSSSALGLIDQMRGQFLGLLQSIGFMPQQVSIENIKSCDENMYGSHMGVVKSAICAGLSPSILMVPPTDAKSNSSGSTLVKSLQETALLTRRRGMPMYVHPSSVMSNCRVLDSPLMVYVEAMKTSKMYARDVTTLLPLSLAIFSGRLTCNARLGLLAVDGWIRFTATANVIRCLLRVRDAMEDAFIEKVLDPMAPPSEQWSRVFTCIVKCIL